MVKKFYFFHATKWMKLIIKCEMCSLETISDWKIIVLQLWYIFCCYRFELRASLIAQLVKNLPAMQETWVWSLGWEDPLEKGKATHFSILAWRIPWTVWLYSLWDRKELDTTERLLLSHIIICEIISAIKMEIQVLEQTLYCKPNNYVI